MSITSASFLLFVLLVIVAYYAFPKRFQWLILLTASAVFYLLGGLQNAFYILVTSSTVYVPNAIA